MTPLDGALIGAGLLALVACIYFALELRTTPNRAKVSSRFFVTAGLVCVNAFELALHRVPVLDLVLLAAGLALVIGGVRGTLRG
jgi:predicted membrane channel-forming protein YqfA (hemolysin III family)